MDIQELKRKINIKNYINSVYDLGRGYNTTTGTLYKNCPICNSTSSKKGDKGHFLINEITQSYSSFSQCCNGGDIIKFLEEFYNISNKEAINKLYEITNTPKEQIQKEQRSGNEHRETVRPEKKETNTKMILRELDKFIDENIGNIYNAETKAYLDTRGISERTAKKYGIFTAEVKGHKKIIIPIKEKNKKGEYENKNYVARAFIPGDTIRYSNAEGLEKIPFNRDYVKTKQEQAIYITEGIFDSLSIEEAGGLAIALNSTNEINHFIEYIKEEETAKQNTYILALDNDKPGREATQKLSEEMKKLNISYEELNFSDEYKDINELYLSYEGNLEGFRNTINPYYNLTSSNYINTEYFKDKDKLNNFSFKETGFNDIDTKLGGGLIPGLYVLGAISSLGKTTFVHQVTDNLADNGEKVLFFSIEQSRLEMTTKTLSRKTYLLDRRQAKTSLEIMQQKESEEDMLTIQAIQNSYNILENTTIIEGNFEMTVLKIREIVEKYIKYTGKKPIVVVDYLQIITPLESKATDRQIADTNIKTLKQISRDNNLTVIVISSLNRENYLKQIDFSSFKETGTIEYSADIVLGLQYSKINNINENKVNEAREQLNLEKRKEPREIEIICLKNRYGRANFKSYLKYYPKYNYFIEDFEKNKRETFN